MANGHITKEDLHDVGLPEDSGSALPGQVGVTGRQFNSDGIFISTSNTNGVEADRGFHVAVLC